MKEEFQHLKKVDSMASLDIPPPYTHIKGAKEGLQLPDLCQRPIRTRTENACSALHVVICKGNDCNGYGRGVGGTMCI